jgi:hypothetical protein
MMKLRRCFESSPMKLAKIFCGASVGSMGIGEKPKSAADQRSALGENLVRRKNLVLSMLILILGWCLTAFTQEKPRPSNTDQGMTSEKAGQEVFRSFCAVCHGTDAKGNGPAVPGLKKRPPRVNRPREAKIRIETHARYGDAEPEVLKSMSAAQRN